jgi:acyl-CoA thioesterase
MNPKIRDAMQRQVGKEPFAKQLGLKLIDVGEGYAVVEMQCKREMENIFRMIHGGAIFALIDEAFEISCNSHGTVAVALNMNITYHQAPSPESKLRAEAREVAKTRRTGNYYITVTDEEERLIASCQALAYRKGDRLPFMDD